MADNTKPHFGGLPTEPSVRRIRQKWPDEKLEEGQLITYDEIEEVIGFPRRSGHFRAVTNKWRKQVEENAGYVVGCRPAIGFIIMDDKQTFEHGQATWRQSVRKAKRSWVVNSRVNRNRLSEKERERLDLTTHRAASVAAIAQIKTKTKMPSLTGQTNGENE